MTFQSPIIQSHALSVRDRLHTFITAVEAVRLVGPKRIHVEFSGEDKLVLGLQNKNGAGAGRNCAEQQFGIPGDHLFECHITPYLMLETGLGAAVTMFSMALGDDRFRLDRMVGNFKSTGNDTPFDWARVNAQDEPDGSQHTFASVWFAHMSMCRVLPLRHMQARPRLQAARRKPA